MCKGCYTCHMKEIKGYSKILPNHKKQKKRYSATRIPFENSFFCFYDRLSLVYLKWKIEDIAPVLLQNKFKASIFLTVYFPDCHGSLIVGMACVLFDSLRPGRKWSSSVVVRTLRISNNHSQSNAETCGFNSLSRYGFFYTQLGKRHNLILFEIYIAYIMGPNKNYS